MDEKQPLQQLYASQFSKQYGSWCQGLEKVFRMKVEIYYNKDRRVFIYLIYLFRVTLSVISTGEKSCPPYCGYRFKYLRK